MSATRTRIAAGILGLSLVTALGTAGVATAATAPTAPTPACAQATTTLATTNTSLAGAKTDNNAEQAAYTTAKNNRARDAAAGDVSATQHDGQKRRIPGRALGDHRAASVRVHGPAGPRPGRHESRLRSVTGGADPRVANTPPPSYPREAGMSRFRPLITVDLSEERARRRARSQMHPTATTAGRAGAKSPDPEKRSTATHPGAPHPVRRDHPSTTRRSSPPRRR